MRFVLRRLESIGKEAVGLLPVGAVGAMLSVVHNWQHTGEQSKAEPINLFYWFCNYAIHVISMAFLFSIQFINILISFLDIILEIFFFISFANQLIRSQTLSFGIKFDVHFAFWLLPWSSQFNKTLLLLFIHYFDRIYSQYVIILRQKNEYYFD